MNSTPAAEAHGRLSKVARAALAAWDIDSPNVTLRLLKYRENAVYSVNLDDRPTFVLRVHRRNYHTDAELRSELLWVRALNREGVPTPRVIPTVAGDMITQVAVPELSGPYQCDLLSWVGGRPLGKIEEQAFGDQAFVDHAYELVGRIAARVHRHSESWRPPAYFHRLSWDEEGCLGPQAVWGHYADLDSLTAEQLSILREACGVARRRLAEFGKSTERYGLIHGDLVPENLLLDGERCTLIDFDDAGFGWYVAEIAVAVFFQAGTPSFAPALRAMVRGYRQVRNLPECELSMLDVMLFLRGLAVLGWVQTRAENETAGALRPLATRTSLALASRLLEGSTDSIATLDFAAR